MRPWRRRTPDAAPGPPGGGRDRPAPFLEDGAAFLDWRAREAPLPAEALVEVTNACNLRCTMCAVASPDYGPVGMMDARTFQRVEGLLPSVTTAALFGHGEPFLHPDLLRWCEVAKGHGAGVTLTTNGTLLTEPACRALVDLGVDELIVSLDGASPETFQAIRGTSLARILDNVRRLMALRDAASRKVPRLTIQAVAMASNVHELPDLVDLAADLGAWRVKVKSLMEHNLPGAALRHEPDRHAPFVARAGDRARARGIDLTLEESLLGGPSPPEQARHVPSPDAPGSGTRRACPQPWRMTYVRRDGTVHPCCGSDTVLGSLHESTFEEIWRGARATSFRRAVASRHQPADCARCPIAPLAPPTTVLPWLRIGVEDHQLGPGWHPPETVPSLRWSTGTGGLFLWRAGPTLRLKLLAFPEPMGVPPLRLTVVCDGNAILERSLEHHGPFHLEVPLPPGPEIASVELITAPTWSPADAGVSADARRLGVALFEAWVAPGD